MQIGVLSSGEESAQSDLPSHSLRMIRCRLSLSRDMKGKNLKNLNYGVRNVFPLMYSVYHLFVTVPAHQKNRQGFPCRRMLKPNLHPGFLPVFDAGLNDFRISSSSTINGTR